MLKKNICYLLLVCLGLIFCQTAQAASIQTGLSERLIRLHVVANSDSEADQAVKLRVRDAVLTNVRQCTQAADPQTAQLELAGCLDKLTMTANAELQRAGVADRAHVTLCTEQFPIRHYPTFDLPAGSYRSLRVTIGSGSGHNWWCVVFPSLCFAATSDEWEQAAAGFTEQEDELLSSGEEVELRFASLDYLKRLWNWVTGS